MDMESVFDALTLPRASPAEALLAVHHGGGRVALLLCERRRDLLGSLTKAATQLGIGIAIGSELGVTPSPAPSSAGAKAAIAAAAAAGTADSTPLGPHASTAHVAAMARGSDDELLAPVRDGRPPDHPVTIASPPDHPVAEADLPVADA